MDHVLTLALLALLIGARAGAAAPNSAAKCANVGTKSAASGVRYTLYSHEEYDEAETSKHGHNLSCVWNITAPPIGSTWLVEFHEIDLESSVAVQRCKYDNLSVTFELNNIRTTTVICGKHYGLTLLTNGSFQLKFMTDASISHRGFNISWRPVRGREASEQLAQMSAVFLSKDRAGSCGSLESLGRPVSFGGRMYNVTTIGMSAQNYVHNADCTWTIPVVGVAAVYVTFEKMQLEGLPPSCSMDNITVTYRLSRRSQSRRRVLCKTNSSLTLVSREMVTLRLRTDHSLGNSFRIKWFLAPYTGLSAMFATSPEFSDETCPEMISTMNGGSINMYYEPPMTYTSRMRCSWIVSVPMNKVADFTFTKFQLARGYRTWRRYNFTHLDNYCHYSEDSVTMMYDAVDDGRRRSESFCYNSLIQLGGVVLSAGGTVMVTFRSNGYRNSHGFILEFVLREQQPTPKSPCPSVKRLDKYRQKIANASGSSIVTGSSCSWLLEPGGANFLMSLTVSLNPAQLDSQLPSQPHMDAMYSPFSRRRLCAPMVVAESDNATSNDALISAGSNDQRTAIKHLRREFCPPVTDILVGLFAGRVNVSISTWRPNLDLKGFSLLITEIPKPQTGCATVNVKTEYRKSQATKVFTITAKAGCIASESLKDSGVSNMYSNSALNVTFQLLCNKNTSTDVLEIISESSLTMVRCGTNESIFGSWQQPLVLKFPAGTDAKLISRVIYTFPVSEGYCDRLNSRTAGNLNGTIGSFLLPLFIDLPYYMLRQRYLSFLSCTYELNYRPGYDILLKISHNLGYDDLDFYCHAKTLDREVNPHIVLTTNERDTAFPDTWVERQLEMCHGYSVGSLGVKTELLVGGSVSISLMALSARPEETNSTDSSMTIRLRQLLNNTMPQQLHFLITYEYVPSCPELTCRIATGPNAGSSCSWSSNMPDIQLQADLTPDISAPSCTWNLLANAPMRTALGRRPVRPVSSWLARVEVSKFFASCPCVGCQEDEFEEFLTISQTDSPNGLPEKIVVCGDFLNGTKVVYMPIGPGQTDIMMAYKMVESGASVRVTFVDCQGTPNTAQCKASSQLSNSRGNLHVVAAPASHGGLIVATIVLTATLIGCLLYMNRGSLIAGGSRIQESMRSRMPPADDMLQLNSESEAH